MPILGELASKAKSVVGAVVSISPSQFPQHILIRRGSGVRSSYNAALFFEFFRGFWGVTWEGRREEGVGGEGIL